MNRLRLVKYILLFFCIFSGCAKEQVHVRHWIYFDTMVSVKIYGEPSSDELDSIWTMVQMEFALCDSLTDCYDSVSAINTLNAAPPGTLHVDTRLAKLIACAFSWRKRTQGKLEPLIGHIVKLWNIGDEKERIPTPEQIDSAITLIDECSLIIIDDMSCIVSGDVELDLGAFAKGFAADKVYESIFPLCLSNRRISGFLIDAGRNIRGWRRNEKTFRIGIANPRGDGVIAAFDLPSGFACASAGDYERFFIIDGIRYHHIFDPATGYPARNAIAATAVSRYALDVDAISTAAVISGLKVQEIIDESNTTVVLFNEVDGGIVSERIGKEMNMYME